MRFFGTDGIRGEAAWLESNDLPKLLGRALASNGNAKIKNTGGERPARIAVARDVRLSSPEIERGLLHGLLEHNAEVFCLGVVPTPALVSVSQTLGVDYAVMVTASHNAPSCNGLKVFDSHGEKLSPEEEALLDENLLSAPTGNANGIVRIIPDGEKIYSDFIKEKVNETFNGFVVRLDCANGCTAELAGKIFTSLGATVIAENDVRDGATVNVGTGSTHMEYLCGKLNEGEIGFAFDGDGDRVQSAAYFFDSVSPKVLDGDYFILSLAMLLQKENLLNSPAVVATELSNGQLDKDLAAIGVKVQRTDVGDKYVLDRLKKENLVLGGERSGHILARCFSPTGDGILSALLLLKARKHGICPVFAPIAQYDLNVKIKNRDEALLNPLFLAELENAKKYLGTDGRILVRKSGTEPLIRIMIESDRNEIREILAKLEYVLENI